MPEMKGIIAGCDHDTTDEELLQFRRSGYSCPIQIGGKIFAAPGIGISTSRHATRLIGYLMNLKKAIRSIKNQLNTNTLPAAQLAKIVGTIGVPIKLGIKFQAGHLIIYEKMRHLNLFFLKALA
jgi:hypothetical protein